jgi:hypothetical protein
MSTDQFFTYYDERGFSMSYPTTWVRQNIMETLAFVKPQEHEDIEKFNTNVNLLIQLFAEEDEIDLDTFTELTKQNMASDMPEATDVAIKDAVVADIPAKEMTFQVEAEDLSLKIKQYWFILGNLAFLLTYTAETEKYEAYEKEATAIILSIEFGFVDDPEA